MDAKQIDEQQEKSMPLVEDVQVEDNNIEETLQNADKTIEDTLNSIKDIPTYEEKEIETELDDTQAKLNELNEKHIRLHAEFDNYRRRTNKEKLDLITHANEKLLLDIIPTIDDFERAIENNKNVQDIEAVKEGFVLIYTKFLSTLEAKGLKQMKAKDTYFDSDLHDAIANVPTTEDKKGKVIDDVEKGYLLNDKVIRFAKVVVGT